MEDPKFFSKLQKGRQPKGITARVVRKWITYDTSGGDVPLHVGMVLADGQGGSMYAQVSDDLIPEKAYLFEIGKVYNIKKFIVQDAKKTFRAVDRNLQIEITPYTSAEVLTNPPFNIPHYVYKITPLSNIKPSKVVYTYTDVLGYLIKYEALHTFVPKNTEKAKMLREIYIKDLRSNIVKITLWADHAANFSINDFYNSRDGNLVLCLVVGCIPRQDFKNNDKVSLTGSSACCWYFNPKIPEASPFYNRFKDTPVYIECPPSEVSPDSQARDVSLVQKTIAALQDIDPFDEEEPGPYKCTVTITSVVNANNWWYMSCKTCKKKAEQQHDHTYKCPKCLCSNTVSRYRLLLTGADDTGEAQFFAYDEEAQKIIQKECEAVLLSLGPSSALPQTIRNILNKTFTFSVDLTDDSCVKMKKKEYQIKAVLERPTKRSLVQSDCIAQPQLTMSETDMHHSYHRTLPGTSMTPTPQHSSLLQIELPSHPAATPAKNNANIESDEDDERSKRSLAPTQRNLRQELDAAAEIEAAAKLNDGTPSNEEQHPNIKPNTTYLLSEEQSPNDASAVEQPIKRLKQNAEKRTPRAAAKK